MSPSHDVPSPSFRHVWGGIAQRIFVLNESTAWTGEEGGRIRFTSDGGTTWQYQGTPNEIDAYVRAIHFLTRGAQAGKRGWAVGSNGRLITTADGGQSWTLVGGPLLYPVGDPHEGQPLDLFDVLFIDAQNGWVCGHRALRRTSDGGQTWTDLMPLNPHFPAGIEFYRFAFIGTGPSLPAVAIAEPGTIVRSTDGTSWATVLEDEIFCPGVASDLELWDVSFKASADPDAAVGYAVGGQVFQCGGFLSTTDGGRTWMREATHSLPPTMYGVAATSGSGAIACSYGGRAYVRQGLGDPEWLDISAQLDPPARNVRVPMWGAGGDGATTVWIVGVMNHVYKSIDAGATWTKQRGEGAWRIRDIHFLDELTGWGVAQNITVLHTQDGGVTWAEQLVNIPGPNLNTVRMRDATRGFAAGDFIPGVGPLVYFYDPAQAPPWRAVTLAPPPGTPSRFTLWSGTWVLRGPLQDAWAVGTGSTVLRSTDGSAQTWSYFEGPAGPPDIEFLSIVFDGVDALYVTGAHRNTGTACAFRLRYPALAWEDLSIGAPGIWRAVAAIGSEVYAVGSSSLTEGTIYRFDPASPPGAPSWDLLVPAPGEPPPQVMTTAALIGQGANRVLFAGGERGAILRFQGGVWSSMKSQTSVNLSGMSFLSPTRGFVVGHGSIDGAGVDADTGLGDSTLVELR